MEDRSKTNFLGNINRGFEEREAQARAGKVGFGYVDLSQFSPGIDTLKIITETDAKDAQVLPLMSDGRKLKLAIIDPENKKTISLLEKLTKEKWILQKFLCSRSAFQDALKWYGSDFLKKKEVEKISSFDEKKQENTKQILTSISELEEKLPSLHSETALGEIEISAMRAKASDIHIQPSQSGTILRFRVDGVLHDVLHIDEKTAHGLVTRIKYEAGMRSNISDIPQDGHMSFSANDRVIDLRISTLPTPLGESVVMRILDSQKGIRSFTELGFLEHSRDKVLEALHAKNGLILVTGPTGSGKTTTLYSILAELNTPTKKLVTLEDPVEYQLDGVSQSQVDETQEYNFETGLSALLRHDPDVILVGEIRSTQTARLSSEAALTGHIVLSSLHTNSATGSIARLRNLGLENFNIAPTLTAVFAQRLVRKICPHCGEDIAFPEDPKLNETLTRLQKVFPDLKKPKTIKKAKGCEKCSGTGYDGRMAICEVFLMDDEIRRMILDGKSEIDVTDYLKGKTDFLTLFEDGLFKVLLGDTTLEELARVAN